MIDGVPYSKTFDSEQEADEYELVTRARHVTGPIPTRVTVRQYAPRWLDGYLDGPESTLRFHETNVRLYITPQVGKMPMVDVRPSDVGRLLAHVARDVSVAKADSVYRTLSALFHSAEQDDLISRVPVKSKRHRPKIQREPHDVLSRGQGREVLMMLGGWVRDAAVMQMTLGARFGEIAGLTPHDLAGGKVTIRRRFTYGTNRVAATKNHRLRTLEVPPTAQPTVDRLLAERHESPPLPDLQGREWDGTRWDGRWLIQTSTARPPNLAYFNRLLKDACRALGVAVLSSHGLRHTYVSWMIDDGHTADQVAQWIGDTPETVRRVYSHMLEGGSAAASESVTTALGHIG